MRSVVLACLLVVAGSETACAAGRVVVGGLYLYRGRCVTVTKLRGTFAQYRWKQGNASGQGAVGADRLGGPCVMPSGRATSSGRKRTAAKGAPRAGQRRMVGGHCVTLTRVGRKHVHYRVELSGKVLKSALGKVCRRGAAPTPLGGGSSGRASLRLSGGNSGALGRAEAKQMVAAHDKLRATYGVKAMTWSPKIAAYAQRWAERLAKRHRCRLKHRKSGRYGENLAMWGGTGALSRPASQAVRQWAAEFKVWNRSRTFGKASFPAGHLTQILWRKTTKLGCGRATCGDFAVVVVCNYAPAGNVMGAKIY